MTNTDRCQLCHARLKAVRLRDGKYDGQPENIAACHHPHDNEWCTLGKLPVPDGLQWLVVSTSYAAPGGSTKAEQVAAWPANRDAPFTLDDVRRAVDCSDGTIRKALSAAGYAYANRPRGTHFYRVYFPLDWSFERIREWLDNDTGSGKSKARVQR